ncbi:hypothetical protein KO465_10135 [Candidatus Micrarchaeota archaeon]|jgi:hypothetical protein|nr:hypothetical protein [Candidatus Micrarchaeota archaeon]
MGKAAIWALVGIGFLLLLIGSAFRSNGGEIIGLLMISGGLYLALSPEGILRKEQVIDNWSILIENAQGNAKMVFKETENFIKKSKAPSVEMKMRTMSPGTFKGLMGIERDFLEITDRENTRMAPYQIYVNARDYGINLDVSWYLTFRPTWLHSLLSMIPFVSMTPRAVSDLDVFDQQDLTVFATNAHHCLLKTVEKLMVSLNQDPSKIDRKSKGFLGIS